MAKHKRLLVQHLEDISWRTLQEYPHTVRDMIRGRSGVYALYRRRQLYYVGLASNLMGRLKTHLKDRHHGSWDRFSVYLTARDDHVKELESLLLRIINPAGNKQTGKFAGSEDLRPVLHRAMREADADRRARLIGGNVAERRRRIKTSTRTGSRALVGVVDRGVPLKGSRGQWEYYARLRADGRISYDGQLYGSPSAAGAAAIEGPCNGWVFWRYRDENGKWVPLRSLRG